MSDPLKAGTPIGGFEIRSVLGAGGFGITYNALDLSKGDDYAIKEYYPAELAQRGTGDTVVVDRKGRKLFDAGLDAFYNEAKLLRTLPRHDALMAIRGLFKKNGTAYVVMELIHGKSLTDLTKSHVRNNRHFPEDLIRHFLTSIGGALSLVHSAGLIHRDIKPDNVMVRRVDGQPILIDFGAARELSSRAQNAIMYTPSYAAYEQIPQKAGGSSTKLPEGPWTDIFAVCVVAYLMMTGQKPPNAAQRADALRKNLPDPYVPVMQNSANRYSETLCNLVDAGCQLEPRNRLQNAETIFSRLGVVRKVTPVRPPQQNTISQTKSQRLQPQSEPKNPMSVQAKRFALIVAGFAMCLYLILVYYGIA